MAGGAKQENEVSAAVDGDVFFVGVDMREPSSRPAGYVSSAVNARFRNGRIEPRWGHWRAAREMGTLYGVASFRRPSATEYTVAVGATGTYVYTPNAPIWFVPYPDGETVEEPVRLVQAFNYLFMFRGSYKRPMRWDAAPRAVDPWVSDWEVVEEVKATPETDPMPNGHSAAYFANRLIVAYGKDEVAVSDPLSYTIFDLALASFWINQGEADNLVSIVPYGKTALVMFKNRSVYLVNNLYGDLSAAALDFVPGGSGLIAPKAVSAAGSSLLYLAEGGVYDLRQVLDNEIQAQAEPISSPIRPLIQRIHWAAVAGATSAVWSGRYYLAVPIDGSTTNNAILVYDFENHAWAGYDTGEHIDVLDWVRFRFLGRDTLGFVTPGGEMWATEVEGNMGDVSCGTAAVQMEVITRGYTCQIPAHKYFQSATVDVSTLNPRFSVTERYDGPGEDYAVIDAATRDRTASFTHRAGAIEEDNSDNRALEAQREDYSIELDGETDWVGVTALCANGYYPAGTAPTLPGGSNYNPHEDDLEIAALWNLKTRKWEPNTFFSALLTSGAGWSLQDRAWDNTTIEEDDLTAETDWELDAIAL